MTEPLRKAILDLLQMRIRGKTAGKSTVYSLREIASFLLVSPYPDRVLVSDYADFLTCFGDYLTQVAQAFDQLPHASPPVAPAPIPMRLCCEDCGKLHIDEGEFRAKPHHTHACQHCGHVWRPAIVPTVGVRFLPSFRNTPADSPQLDQIRSALGIGPEKSVLEAIDHLITAKNAAQAAELTIAQQLEEIRACVGPTSFTETSPSEKP